MKSLIGTILLTSLFIAGCGGEVVVMEPSPVAMSSLAASEEHAGRPTYSPTPSPKPVAKVVKREVKKKRTQRAARSRRVTAPLTNGNIWDKLAVCESGGNWSINTGNGYYGGLQFSLSSWKAVGGSGLPSNASRSEQISRGEMLRSRQGWGAWPACSRKLGLR